MENIAAEARQDGPRSHATGDPALRVTDLCLEYPDGTDERGEPRTVRALDCVSLELAARPAHGLSETLAGAYLSA